MKKHFSYYAVVLLMLLPSLSGCNSVKMRVETSDRGIAADSIYCYGVNAHGTFWNLTNTSIQKTPRDIEVAPFGNNPPRKIRVTDGTDFIGKKNNYSVVYHITYWDSFLAVVTLGLYVPFRIEYCPTKQ